MPGEFLAEPPAGTRLSPPHMNDRNREEPARYVREDVDCHFFVELCVGDDGRQRCERARQSAHGGEGKGGGEAQWRIVACAPFLDVEKSTRAVSRAFWVPRWSAARNTFADYCLLERRASEEKGGEAANARL